MLTKEELEMIRMEADVHGNNRCPDYDEDCALVKNHLKCFLGLPSVTSDGHTVCTGQAKGYCPFIHPEN